MPAGSDIHVPEHRSNRAVPSCLAIHSPQDRGKLAHSSSLGIYSPVKEGKRAVPSNPEIHSPAVGSLGIHRLDIRKQDICNIHRLGSRNKCPAEAEVYSRLLQLSRLLLRSPRRGRLPARHPPLLQWQHPKPLPRRPHPGRAGRDHKGWCRPRGPALTRQSHRAQIGSLSLSP